MFKRRRARGSGAARHRRLQFENLESKCMLSATKVDLLFIVDESGSELDANLHNWLASIVDELHATFTNSQNSFDVRYGLVGFGEFSEELVERFAHSQLVKPNVNLAIEDRLFTSSPSEIASAIEPALAELGGIEDGWDAIEHAISEANFVSTTEHAAGAAYGFRDGAVPVFVLAQNEEGRVNLEVSGGAAITNDSLTHDGVLAALKSKNILLNSLVVGPDIDLVQENFSERLFDLSAYNSASNPNDNFSPDIRILGVEADEADGVLDGYHDYAWTDTNSVNSTSDLPTATTAETLQISYNGSNTGASGMVASGKSILIGTKLTGGIGPSAFGYRAKSVPFDFVDISATGTEITPGTPVTFSFPYFGTNYGQVYVNEDGTITFGSANFNGSNVDLSRSVSGQARPSGPMIAALWDDLTKQELLIGEDPEDSKLLWKLQDVDGNGQSDLVVQWNEHTYVDDLGLFSTDEFNGITFQAILYADGRIGLNYKDLESFAFNDQDPTSNETGGISATVGIWKGGASSVDAVSLPLGKFVPGPHYINGSTLQAIVSNQLVASTDTNDSYVRLAWDTGGAAWDVGVVDEYATVGGILSDEANALRDAFVSSLAKQIARQAKQGKVFQDDSVLRAINYGGGAVEGFEADPSPLNANNHLTTTDGIDVDSNSIPFVPGSTSTKVTQVFQSARKSELSTDTLDLSITTLNGGATLTNGTYIVELFFSELSDDVLSPGAQVFDVVVEGKTLLNDYDIYDDRARIEPFDSDELDVQQAGAAFGIPAGVVKRFEVEVVDAVPGLQVSLVPQQNPTSPSISGLRILRADAPRVENVVLKGSTWANGIDYSYADVVPDGNQLRPMYRTGADRIEVHFDGPVNLANANLVILGDGRAPIATTPQFVGFNSTSHVATWELSGALPVGKYALQLTGVTGANGVGLDSEWMNLIGPINGVQNADDFDNHPKDRQLLSGDGMTNDPSSTFEFWFSVLPGDYNQDGIVNSSDSSALKDGNGDGVVDGNDGQIVTNALNTPVITDNALVASKRRGDYNENELVDQSDYQLWKTTFGNTPTHPDPNKRDMRADGNFDNSVGAADYTVWRDPLHQFSAWYLGPAPTGSGGGSGGTPVFDPLNVPRVANVTISASNQGHWPYHFNLHDGSGEQLHTVPVGGADTVSITFTEDVNITADTLTLIGLRTANRPVLANFSYDLNTMTASWRFTGWSFGDQYLISLSDAVTDVEGYRLDGEWTNPASVTTVNAAVSEFPSGDGVAGGDFNFVAAILPGDANIDSVVDSYDLDILANNYNSGEFAMFFDGDFNGDNVVDGDDVDIWLQNVGTNLQNLQMLADLNGDWVVDDLDGDILFDNYLANVTNPTQAQGDLDGDSDIDVDDLDLMFAQYGLELAVVA